ncbi:MAG: sulfurtransferase complex subunit TusC [Arenicellales bacterium WSBS_2016_MAG_OTU3]
MSEEGTIKKFLYINRRAPHGTVYAQEGLEVALIGAAFDQDVSMAFIDDGVFQLCKSQDTKAIEAKNFCATFKALGDYEVTKLYVEQESLAERGLSQDDLMPLTWEDEDDDWAEKPSIHIVDKNKLADLIEEQDVILNF